MKRRDLAIPFGYRRCDVVRVVVECEHFLDARRGLANRVHGRLANRTHEIAPIENHARERIQLHRTDQLTGPPQQHAANLDMAGDVGQAFEEFFYEIGLRVHGHQLILFRLRIILATEQIVKDSSRRIHYRVLDLYEELNRVLKALEERNLDYALCGALALAVHGYPRATKDIDLLILEKDLAKIKEAVATVGFTYEAFPMTFQRGTKQETRVHRVSKISDGDVLILDLILVESNFVDAWNSREKYKVRGHSIAAISKIALIDMKKRAGRPRDAGDIHVLEVGNDEQA